MPVPAVVSRFFRKFSLPHGKQFAKLRLEGLEDRQVMDHSLFAIGSPAGEVSLVKIIDRDTGDTINEFQPYASKLYRRRKCDHGGLVGGLYPRCHRGASDGSATFKSV